MRCSLSLALTILLSSTAFAQGDMEQKLQEKLQKPFVKNAAWHLDFDAAKKQAKESGKIIFAYFTRSYAP